MHPINEDLRSIKTERALYASMLALLKIHSFKKITVKGICEESLVSRAAFYAHFIDKYDLLKQLMTDMWAKNFSNDITYEYIEKTINSFIDENTKILRNLFEDADPETYEIIFEFILSTKKLTVKKEYSRETYQKNVVFSNFYAGGIISYFLWQIKNKFPQEVPLMNKSFYEIINTF